MNRRRILSITLASVAAILLAAVMVWNHFSTRYLEPWQFLAHVVQVEQAGVDQTSVQPLGWSLAILGRDDEVRAISFRPIQRPPSTVDLGRLDLHSVPWEEGIREIAADHRIVMIMEDHFISKHREFVGATLPAFKDAGFTHYAAEAVSRFDVSLAERGYPNKFTGLYTSDPRFGNVIRRALSLELTVIGYDAANFRATTHEEREESAATRLAELFQNGAKTKLLVHVGHAHVLKYETTLGQRWLASRLWEKTGFEPFTIWQWSSKHDAHDYDKIVGILKARGIRLDEPVLLMPPPTIESGLYDAPYGLASVDAIVLHPQDDSVAPAHRTVVFPNAMQRLAGRWTGSEWPVVVSAYKKGEPIDAVPLDQVMLRQGETNFVLWIPADVQYVIRIFNGEGVLDSQVETDSNSDSISPVGRAN